MKKEVTNLQPKDIFYNSQRILSYKRLYNMICHLRGKGKTYHFTKKCIELGIKARKVSFVVLARYKEDIIAMKDSWWQIVEHLFPEYHFLTSARIIYAYNEKEKFPIGEFIALNQYVRAKKTPRPYVKLIWFDECLNEEMDYLANEIDAFISICDSVIRNRDDCRVVLTSNTISMLNPYFEYFGITALNSQFTKGKHDSVVEYVAPNDPFIEYRKQTTFGQTIKDTSYGQFAIEGKFMLDDTTNVVGKAKGNYHYLWTIVLHDLCIGVYSVNCLTYFKEEKLTDTKQKFTPYLDDARNNGAIYQKKDFGIFERIATVVTRDEVMYETLKVKNEILIMVRWKLGCLSANQTTK